MPHPLLASPGELSFGFSQSHSLFCAPLGRDAQDRRQKDAPGSCPRPGPQEAGVGAVILCGSPCPPGPNLMVLPPTSPKAHCAAYLSGENKAAALCPACPLPASSFTWDLHGLISCLDAHGFPARLPARPLPVPPWRQRSMFCPSCPLL